MVNVGTNSSCCRLSESSVVKGLLYKINLQPLSLLCFQLWNESEAFPFLTVDL